mmetsp:Transcript_35876/g.35499  ORF Transcript_35876/g.35499 Transcript_35876/m.35499 type:complete len:167 (+) Transcript_35876:102-602(+)
MSRRNRVQVCQNAKVIDLKHKILEDLSVPLERQRLIFMGKQLKDNLTLHSYKIKEDVCILLVANRAQNRSQPPRRTSQGQDQNQQSDDDLESFLFTALNESAQMRRNRRLLFQQNASSFLRNIRLNISESREAITQNIASTQMLLDTRKEIEEAKAIQPNSSDPID